MRGFDRKDIYGILNCISDGVFITDDKGEIVMLNKASERLCEFSGKQLIGRNMKDLVKEGYFSDCEAISLKCIESGHEESMIQKGKDDEQELTVTGVPLIEDGRLKFVVVTERDVSEINRLEKALRKNRRLLAEYSTQLEQYRANGRGALDSGQAVIYDSKVMEQIISMLNNIASKDVTVLLQGESGTGKEVIASYIHNISDRKDRPFIKVNCGAIPENLFESEFFGYESGSFTGASDKGKIGIFERANGGTLFLDEIGIMPTFLQGKILRVLQSREITRIGGNEEIQLDIRLIAATNTDLKEAVRKGEFRQDLYYRLNEVPVTIPPLRERREDIFPLARYFIKEFNEKFDADLKISKDGWKALYQYQWPGNVRELQNIIKRLTIISGSGEVEAAQIIDHLDNFGIEDAGGQQKGDLKSCVDDFEKRLIISRMKYYRSSGKLAEALGIDKSTLNRKIKKYGIKAEFTD